MQKLIRYLSISVFAVLLTSCYAVHSGMMTGNAALSDSNFEIVDFAVGTSETIKILGVGGLNTDAMVLDAKRNLYENHPLKKGQALANVTVDFKTSNLLFVMKTKVTVSAEIVDFNPNEKNISYVNDTLLDTDTKDDNSFFKNGERVFVKVAEEIKSGRVIDLRSNKIVVQYFDHKNRFRSKQIAPDKAFISQPKKKNSKRFNYEIGDQVFVKVSDQPDSKISARVVGLGQDSALVIFEGDRKKSPVEYKHSSIVKK